MQIKNTNIKWLRISYWTGAIVDLICGVIMVFFPGFSKHIWGLNLPIQEAGHLGWKYAGAMIIAWTFLLLWADRKPLERKGTLLLTCFPVLFGLMAAEVYAIIINIASVPFMVFWLGAQTMLLILFGFSYLNAKEIEG